jgi:phosphatidylglycerol:prolipoprotein diacylglycerol transferase
VLALIFPDFDPVALSLGPLHIRWYALAYIAGLLLGMVYIKWMVRRPPHAMTPEQVDDFLVWATLGVVLGGRLGYVLFYQPDFYVAHPLQIPAVWHGGMSFHGGLLGVLTAITLFSRRHKLNLLAVGDVVSTAVPIGLFFGRIANFINGELFGRIAPPDLPWGMIFPGGGPLPRYPSELIEASLEGLTLGLILMVLWRRPAIRLRPGTLSGCFLVGYGLARITSEFFRQPDPFLGYLWGGATMGQLLSIPLVIAGIALAWWAARRQPVG